jgi:hypothetical protein
VVKSNEGEHIWFSQDIPASSTTKTGRHDIAEINIAESGVKHNKSNQISEPIINPREYK